MLRVVISEEVMLGLAEYKHASSLEHGHHLFVAERSIGFCFFEHKDKIANFVCKHHIRDKAAKSCGQRPFLGNNLCLARNNKALRATADVTY